MYSNHIYIGNYVFPPHDTVVWVNKNNIRLLTTITDDDEEDFMLRDALYLYLPSYGIHIEGNTYRCMVENNICIETNSFSKHIHSKMYDIKFRLEE